MRIRLSMSLTHIISTVLIMKGENTFLPNRLIHQKRAWEKFAVKSEEHHFICEFLSNSTEENGTNWNKWKGLLLYGLWFHTSSSTSG